MTVGYNITVPSGELANYLDSTKAKYIEIKDAINGVSTCMIDRFHLIDNPS